MQPHSSRNSSSDPSVSVPATAAPVTQNDSKLPNGENTFCDKALSQQQFLAIEAILMGMTQNEIANHAGVARKTLYNWRYHDEDFRRELSLRLDAVWQSSIDRLRALIPTAVSTLETQMLTSNRHDRMRAALALLRLADIRHAVPLKPASLSDSSAGGV